MIMDLIMKLIILFTLGMFIWFFGTGFFMILGGDVTGVYYVNMGVLAFMVHAFGLMVFQWEGRYVSLFRDSDKVGK